MPLIVESYRLRALVFEWEKRAGDACDEFPEYKGGIDCYTCHASAQAHQLKDCAKELRALVDQAQEQRHQSPAEARCAACGGMSGDEIHYVGTVDSHPFVAATPAAGADPEGRTSRSVQLTCNECRKPVSTWLYPVPTDTPDGGLIVRAWIQCPECVAAHIRE